MPMEGGGEEDSHVVPPVAKDLDDPLLLCSSSSSMSDIIHDIATAGALNLSCFNDDADASIILDDAHQLFLTALRKEELFGRGRRATKRHVASACLYLALRRHRKPYMLLHFSDYLKVSVYVLGAVFVALSRILHLQQLTAVEEDKESLSSCIIIIDPSLFMHRMSTRLLGTQDAVVAATALRIISSTSSSSSSSSLKPRDWMLIATHEKKDIPIHLCTAALYIAATAHDDDDEGNKFSISQVLSVVRAEFDIIEEICGGGGIGLSMEEFSSRAVKIGPSSSSEEEELVCRHKKKRKNGQAHFRHGLCSECHHVFLDICGRGAGGLEKSRDAKRRKRIKQHGPEEEDDDVDDFETRAYLNSEREKQYKTTIWELMYKEYLEDQSSKAVSAALATNLSSHANSKSTKERKKRRARDASAAAAAEATNGKFPNNNKKLSSRINYDLLSKLYADETQCQKATETDIVGTGVEQSYNITEINDNDEKKDTQGRDDSNEADIYGDDLLAEGKHDGHDFDDGEGEYNEYFGDGDEEYADNDFWL